MYRYYEVCYSVCTGVLMSLSSFFAPTRLNGQTHPVVRTFGLGWLPKKEHSI
jgi:hypothetical protein